MDNILLPVVETLPSVVQVLTNYDLINVIFSQSNIMQGCDYKSICATCVLWHNVLYTPKRAHTYMNVVSTLVMRHPNLKWRFKHITRQLSQKTLEEYSEQIAWYDIPYNDHIDMSFIRANITRCHVNDWLWNKSVFSNMEFIYEFKDQFRPSAICEFVEMNDDIIRDFADKLDWIVISYNRNLTEQFIEKYADKLHWDVLSCNRALSTRLIDKYEDKFNKTCSNQNMSLRIIIKYYDPLESFHIFSCKSVNTDFIREYIPKITQPKHNEFWRWVSLNPNLDIVFIREFADDLNWSLLDIDTLSLEIINEFVDKIQYYHLIYYSNIDNAFLENNLEKLRGIWYD